MAGMEEAEGLIEPPPEKEEESVDLPINLLTAGRPACAELRRLLRRPEMQVDGAARGGWPRWLPAGSPLANLLERAVCVGRVVATRDASSRVESDESIGLDGTFEEGSPLHSLIADDALILVALEGSRGVHRDPLLGDCVRWLLYETAQHRRNAAGASKGGRGRSRAAANALVPA